MFPRPSRRHGRSAASVERRWDADRETYTRHMDWFLQDGRTRTRQTARQAAVHLQTLEDAKARVEAEEACDDPLKMIPFILQNKAVKGRVMGINADATARWETREWLRRPLVTLLSPDPLSHTPKGPRAVGGLVPCGRPYEYIVHEVRPDAGGSLLTLKLSTGMIVQPTCPT